MQPRFYFPYGIAVVAQPSRRLYSKFWVAWRLPDCRGKVLQQAHRAVADNFEANIDYLMSLARPTCGVHASG